MGWAVWFFISHAETSCDEGMQHLPPRSHSFNENDTIFFSHTEKKSLSVVGASTWWLPFWVDLVLVNLMIQPYGDIDISIILPRVMQAQLA